MLPDTCRSRRIALVLWAVPALAPCFLPADHGTGLAGDSQATKAGMTATDSGNLRQ